ncbi:MAG: protein kinase domain-containing protein [Azovibrio sp.]
MENIGKYRVIRELGKGTTAVVYLCQGPEKDAPLVAVKLVRFDRDNAAMSKRLRKLFQTEGVIANRLDHPHIVRIHEAVVEHDYAYIAMEYVEGTSLEDFCRIDRLLPLHRVIGIIFKCALALDHAYRQGIIHRDIKPANILLDKDDNPKLADFGLAININKDMDRDSTFVMGVGSPAYMSPEQIKGYPLNQKTDLYSLGVVLFQMLTGRLPFRAKNQATLVYKIINTDTPVISELNPSLPEKMDQIIKKLLEKDLYNRYRNGTELAKDLSSVRYQIVGDDDPVVEDNRHFEMLRRMGFFVEFENIELWELIRSSIWRQIGEGVTLFREGETDTRFGILIRGGMEVSLGGKKLCHLGDGEVVGEMAHLYGNEKKRHATIVTTEPCLFLEINGAALALSSEELQERMQTTLVRKVIERLREANRLLAVHGAEATKGGKGTFSGTGTEPLELLPI